MEVLSEGVIRVILQFGAFNREGTKKRCKCRKREFCSEAIAVFPTRNNFGLKQMGGNEIGMKCGLGVVAWKQNLFFKGVVRIRDRMYVKNTVPGTVHGT